MALKSKISLEVPELLSLLLPLYYEIIDKIEASSDTFSMRLSLQRTVT